MPPALTREQAATVGQVQALGAVGFDLIFGDQYRAACTDLSQRLQRPLTDQETMQVRARIVALAREKHPEQAAQARQRFEQLTAQAKGRRNRRRRRAFLVVLAVLALLAVALGLGCRCPAGMVRTGFGGVGPNGQPLKPGRCVVPE